MPNPVRLYLPTRIRDSRVLTRHNVSNPAPTNASFCSQVLAAFCACGALAAPAGQVVPILKQVNRQNEDGSYSYGYENADGTYKIETKYPTGEVFGKYGYVDETGKLRTVEYGASARGFEPSGTDITVPPPSLGGESNDLHGRDAQQTSADDYDDGQYREDPSVYYRSEVQQQVQSARQQQQQWSAPIARQQQHQPQKARSSDPMRNFQAHPSVRDFDPATGSFSISYTG